MNKIVFITGVMGSAKTANALMQYYELKQQNKYVVLLKPSVADRDGKTIIKSRIGLEAESLTFNKNDDLKGLFKIKGLDVVIVDECQFCTEEQINNLKKLTIKNNVRVYCYGLKMDFTTHLFEGSKRLLEIADEIKYLEMSCCECGKPAEVNALFDKNNNLIKIKNNDTDYINGNYKPLCYDCWLKRS